MENAGRILAKLTIELFDPPRVSVLVGKGNNGGGGLVAARYLHNMGVEVEMVLSTREIGAVPLKHLATLQCLEVPIGFGIGHTDGIIIDAMLGYNQIGAPRGGIEELITKANEAGLPVVSLDVPSGFDLSSGKFHDVSFRNSTVLTLGLPKENMLGIIEDLWLADIGIPHGVYRRVGIDVNALFKGEDHLKLR
jgi:NAD(P)H-hydrate epimerase